MYGTETKRSASAANTKAVVVPLINPGPNFPLTISPVDFSSINQYEMWGSPQNVRNNDNTVETVLP